ncbi:MAG TPA: hypothetical protein VGK73_26125 [Polyangiaceae bacterium]
MEATTLGYWGIPLAMLGGAIRVSTPFLFVSLGECVTERSWGLSLKKPSGSAPSRGAVG